MRVTALLLLTFSFGSGSLAFGQSSDAPRPPSVHATELLEAGLQDKNPDARKHTVQALGLASVSDIWLTRLEAMIDDKDVEVRLAVITSLVDLKSPRTVPALKKALNSSVPEVSFAAAKALWTLKDPAGQDALVDVLSGETKARSGFLTRQKRDALRMMHTPRTLFMFALTTGVNFVPVPGAGAGVSSVEGILSDPSVSGRAAAALLLSDDKDPKVLEALFDALNDKEWSVRAAAVHALCLRNDPSLAPKIEPMINDKNDAVAMRAAAGYLRLERIRADRAARRPSRKK